MLPYNYKKVNSIFKRRTYMSVNIEKSNNFKFLGSLNGDNTVILAEDLENSEKVILREVNENSLDIFKKISAHPHQNVERVTKLVRVKHGYIAVCGFCGGFTLRNIMDTDPALLKAGIVRISQQLCDAACHLHKLGLVHRDIKPENIIVDFGSLDEKVHTTLIDFDISRARSRNGGKAHDTGLFGTPGYAAPEQYGFGETDFRADIYAAGRVTGDMLACCGYPEELRDMWKKVIEKCTEYSPDNRYKSYEIMKREIEKIWDFNRALLMMELGHPVRALKTVLFGEKKTGDIEDDFMVIDNE